MSLHTLLTGNRALYATLAPKQKPVLDSAEEDIMVADSAKDFAMQTIATQAVASVQDWAETTAADLEEGESLADRLFFLMVGVADENQDGELDEAEQAVVETAMNVAWDYLSGKGAAEEDLDALFGDDPAAASAAADRVQQMLMAKLPDGEDAAADEIDDFAFGDGQDAVFDGIFDAVYKKKFAIRDGKKVRVMKRVSGTVRLSGKQRLAIRKASMKSRSAGAMHKRMRSMRRRTAMGLK